MVGGEVGEICVREPGKGRRAGERCLHREKNDGLLRALKVFDDSRCEISTRGRVITRLTRPGKTKLLFSRVPNNSI